MIETSITVGELRAALEGVPDSVEVRIDKGMTAYLDPIHRVRHVYVEKSVSLQTIETVNSEATRAAVLLCLTR